MEFGFIEGFSVPKCASVHIVQQAPRTCIKIVGTMPRDEITTRRKCRGYHYFQSSLLASGAEDNEDDGWGAEDEDTTTKTISASSSGPAGVEERELAALRAQMAEKRAPATRNTNMLKTDEPERDLFIPIFAIISLAGLFGAYGYEMLRLYSRGELYLPWNQ